MSKQEPVQQQPIQPELMQGQTIVTWRRWVGRLSAVWGILGILGLLGFAILRMADASWEATSYPMDWRHWLLLTFSVAVMAHAEGYRGFQKSFAPRVVARARYLVSHWTWGRVILAPLFCMGFFHATRRRLISAWLLTTMIILLVLAFRLLDQPWRGILDAGVVVGLVWGVTSIALYSLSVLMRRRFNYSPEVP